MVERKKISNGILEVVGDYVLDAEHLEQGLAAPFIVDSDRNTYLSDSYEGEAIDGLWLIEIDRIISLRELVRYPGGIVRVENGKTSFECQAEEIKVLGKVISKSEFL